ncbi:hypothetical protein A3F00_02800 [Candidatus Daviesbacteria bacterium RIFCSPHIGHO2_12_FULL_37_11]|uniref:DUF305 domain-containing protein n=1 Tax=Candidatus Daviesbacteria bacterium RIFCSPHIGHO2_12_FULL_37_11 TaxID=1797777 RepID=A0A1F5K994_9BACT|nr:MAG: hypothetical protein A2769_01895 [Candidatus Daviesbacteria bacterium RIFCSPHIGHO2_01_FULL_37_27]OGE37380.1 MAG: hypothetical protein A3F00_02800 [Candidatus Daviesbacteria bacterium RIFCSPHIGHO2_12_FULL_37_11]OGE45546.1 MAG: hypothetical protein A3B39_05035 [Candidatus Daviesbacteria bacterium RIFCSPLOWO2_01_FULL_37_10]
MKQNNQLIYGLTGVIIGGIFVWLLTVNALNNNMTSMMQLMGIRQAGSQNATSLMGNIDQHFIEQMIPHHEDAIIMAQLAQERATHTEIKVLANNIITSQSEEITKMRNWYKDWFGIDVPKSNISTGMEVGMRMQGGMMGDETDLEKLRNVSNFDKEFIGEMIPHHQMAVMMAQMLKNTTNKEEMRTLADNIISVQTKEINEMREWYKAWGY